MNAELHWIKYIWLFTALSSSIPVVNSCPVIFLLLELQSENYGHGCSCLSAQLNFFQRVSTCPNHCRWCKQNPRLLARTSLLTVLSRGCVDVWIVTLCIWCEPSLSSLSSLVFLVDVLYEVRSDAVWRRWSLVESSHAEFNLEMNELLYFLMHFLYVFFMCFDNRSYLTLPLTALP